MEEAHYVIIIIIIIATIFKAEHSRNSLFSMEMVKLMTYVFDYLSCEIISAFKKNLCKRPSACPWHKLETQYLPSEFPTD